MTDAFKKLYQDNVIVSVVTLPVNPGQIHVRKTRSLMQDDEEEEENVSLLCTVLGQEGQS